MSTLEKLYNDRIKGVNPLPAPRPPNNGTRFFKGKGNKVNLYHYIGPGLLLPDGTQEPGTYFRVKDAKIIAPPYPKGSVPDGSFFITAHGLPARRGSIVEGEDGHSIWQWVQSKPHSATNTWKLYYPRQTAPPRSPQPTPARSPQPTPQNPLQQQNQQLRGMLGEALDALEQCKNQRDTCLDTLAALRTPEVPVNEEELLSGLIDEFDGDGSEVTGGYRRRKRSAHRRRRGKRATRRKHRKRRRRTRHKRRRHKRRTRRK